MALSQSSVAIEGTATIGDRLLRVDDLPEISAQALDKWRAFAQQIRGQFSIIANSQEASIAVTDLTGSWPVFLNESASGGAFGGSLSSVTSGPPLTLRSQGVVRYLAFGHIGGSCSLVAGVRTLPGASVSIRHGGKTESTRWFDWAAAARVDRAPVADLEEEFRALVASWAKAHLPKNGRVGLLLSGGTDSGLVAALMKPLLGDRLLCITQDFFARRYSERAAATETAQRLQVPIVAAPIGRSDYYKAFVELNAGSQNSAVWATEAHNLYCLANFARQQGIHTLLSGYGADYLFLGQGHFFKSFPPGQHEYLEAISQLGPEEKLRWVIPQKGEPSQMALELSAALGISTGAYSRWQDEFIEGRLDQLGRLAPIVDLPSLQQISCQIDGGVEWQAEHGCLAVMRALPGCTILCPFYDSHIIRFALKLPPDLIFRDGQSKYFLRRLFQANAGLVRVKSHASLSPLRYWRFVPSRKEYDGMGQSLRGLYRRFLSRNLLKSGALYNDLARIAALGVWMGSHQVTPSTTAE